ncbi:MAG: FAD-dependent oxidoreductase, partial [Bacteroidota bacterium]
EFVFALPRPLNFTAGQYLEWTLPHPKADQRGIRRYFTIASAPSESALRLAVKMVEGGSTFKSAMKELTPGQLLFATARAGDFVLTETDASYLFIAGGIGVTPFISHIRSALATGKSLNAILLYACKSEDDVAYRSLFEEVATLGVHMIPILSDPSDQWSGERGFITAEMLQRLVPDYQDRRAYISGPPAMVNAYTVLLKKNGVRNSAIKTDYFPGLA